jgi:hypothetical protein
MKRIDNFFTTAPYWKIFLVALTLTTVIFFIMSSFFWNGLVDLNGNPIHTNLSFLKIGLAFGVFSGTLICLTTSMARNNIKFWDKADVVRELINKANTKKQLMSIRLNDYKELKQLSSGVQHYTEVKHLNELLTTKETFIK